MAGIHARAGRLRTAARRRSTEPPVLGRGKIALLGALVLVCLSIAWSLVPRSQNDSAVNSARNEGAVDTRRPDPDGDRGFRKPGGKEASPSPIGTTNFLPVADSGVGQVLGDDDAEDLDGGFCRSDLNCPLNVGCVRGRCMASSCETDTDCSDGHFCRVGNQASARPAIRVCTSAGLRLRGDGCSDFGGSADSSCGPGLHCLFGNCGPRCDEDAGACGAFEGCVHSYRESLSVCLPDCRKSGCPSGRLCLALGELAKCVEPTRDNCLVHGCSNGESCQVSVQGGQATFRCRRTCDSLNPSCPAGTICGGEGGQNSFCYTKCIPGEPTQVCLPNESCSPVDEDGRLFGCR